MIILQRLARLLDVKSLVTLALVLVLCVMTIGGREMSELFGSAVMLVLGFFSVKMCEPTESAVRKIIWEENDLEGK